MEIKEIVPKLPCFYVVVLGDLLTHLATYLYPLQSVISLMELIIENRMICHLICMLTSVLVGLLILIDLP